MQKYTESVANAQGLPLPGASILVTQYPSGTPATIYSDNGLTQTANPIISDPNGRFSFYAADGHYSLTITGTGITATTVTDVLLEDPTDGGSAASYSSLTVNYSASATGADENAINSSLMNSKPSGGAAARAVQGNAIATTGYAGTGKTIGVTGLAGANAAVTCNSIEAILCGLQFTAAATVTNAASLFVNGAMLNSGAASITNLYGIQVNDPTFYGSALTAGIGLAVTSGSGRYNIYASGTAINYMAAHLMIGTTTDSGAMLTVTTPGTTNVQTWSTTGNTTNGSLSIGFDTNGDCFLSNVPNSTLQIESTGSIVLNAGSVNRVTVGSGGNITIAAPASGQTLAMTGTAAGAAALTLNTTATTGAQTASFSATNKPGAASGAPQKWIPIVLDGTTYYIPAFS